MIHNQVSWDLALKAVVEALRMNPDRYEVIYNSKYNNNESVFDSNDITSVAISSPHSPKSQNQNYYYNEYRQGLLEIAEGFLKTLLNQLVDNVSSNKRKMSLYQDLVKRIINNLNERIAGSSTRNI
jgi:hypothetical protein